MAINLPDPGQQPWAQQLNAALAQLDAQTVISGTVTGDSLILTRNNGTTIAAGNVRGPAGAVGGTGAFWVVPWDGTQWVNVTPPAGTLIRFFEPGAYTNATLYTGPTIPGVTDYYTSPVGGTP